jgi:DNA modification methylase
MRRSPPSVTLRWAGRDWGPGASGTSPHPELETTEAVGRVTREQATLVHGDALDVARAIRPGAGQGADLVYIDPPFASQAEYVQESRLDGPADGRVRRSIAYDDRWRGGDGVAPYLEMLAPRLDALAALLAPTGTIWVHVDWRASPYVRLLLDEILGREAFVNEIVWRRAPNLGRQAASHQFGRTLDTIVVYGGPRARLVPPTRLEPIDVGAVRFDDEGRPFTTAPRGDYTDQSIARLDREGRVHRTATGRVYVKYFVTKDARGAWCRERRVDALWTDVPPLRHASVGERTGYPTQKPRALLDRIVACATPPGGLVVDLFAGSGTTGESAHALGRRFVLGDASPIAIATARARLMRAGVPLVVRRCAGAGSTGAVRVRVAVERRGDAVCVALREPEEPLAWAIDAAYEPSLGFRTAWHSERVPGARPRAAAREAVIESARATVSSAPDPLRGVRAILVRVWTDDGRVGTRAVEAP